jgi:sugar phosphate isomerase/epimerase
MHVKDLRKGATINSMGVAPDEDSVAGEEQIDWPAVLKAAQAAGIEYYFIEDEQKTRLNRFHNRCATSNR